MPIDTPIIHVKNPNGQGEIILSDASANDHLVTKLNGTENYSIDINGLPDTTSNQQYFYWSVCVGDIVANSDSVVPYLFKKPEAVTMNSARISVDTDIGDDDANYQTIQLVDGGSNNILSSGFTTDIAWTGGTSVSLGALNGTHKILTADETVHATFTKTSSGKAMVAVTFHFVFTLEA